MSELRADTITASNGTGPVTLTKQMAIKCWSCFQNTGGSDVSENESFNVSSLTDVNSNDTQIDMTNQMSNANFCELATHGGSTAVQDRFISFVHDNKTSSRMFATAYDVVSGDVGVNEVNVAAVGDLL
tara:strand:+ start:1525 stop:1908 length:384 start_codon:yes stop_codon:yes gene_type:complete